MKRHGLIVFIACIMCMGLPLFAYEGEASHVGAAVQIEKAIGNDYVGGSKFAPTPLPLDESQLADPNDPTSNVSYDFDNHLRLPERNEGSYGNPRWGNDILVFNTEVGESQDMDEDEVTHDIYIAFDTYQSTGDSVMVCKSTDGGDTWQPFSLGTNNDGSIGNARVRVARDGSGQGWVVFGGIWYEPSGARTLWTRRVRTDGSGATFEQVVPDSVIAFDLDAGVGSGAAVYCAYYREFPTFNSVWASRNLLGGSGWQNNQFIFDDPQTNPYAAIAINAGGTAGIAFIDDRITTNQEIRIKRTTDYGVTWINSEQVSNNSGAYPLTYTEIAYSHTTVGWIFATFNGTSAGQNLAFYTSTNSGVNWSYVGLISPYADDQAMSTLRAHKATGHVTLAYNCDPGDSTMFSWALASSPNTFDPGIKINDYNATGLWPPVAGWIYRNPGYWSAITYSPSSMGYRPYFDWFGNVSVAENTSNTMNPLVSLVPNPSKGNARLSYTVGKAGKVTINLHDASGKLVKNILNDARSAGVYSVNLDLDIPAGVYFVNVVTSDNNTNRKLVILQ